MNICISSTLKLMISNLRKKKKLEKEEEEEEKIGEWVEKTNKHK